MDPRWVKWIRVAGRVLLAAIFVLSGASKLFGWSGTVAYAASHGVNAFLLAGATALELAGGLSLLTGYKARWGSVALLVFLVPVTLVFHNFWAVQGQQQQLEMVNFLKNVGIAGGLLMVLSSELAGATAVAGSPLPAPGR